MNQFENRIEDFNRIERELKIPANCNANHQKKLSDRFDVSFFLGDYNFRLNFDLITSEILVNGKMYSILLSEDEFLVKSKELYLDTFTNFKEGKITFGPTYKIKQEPNLQYQFDESHIPCYTDRILFA